MSQHDYDIATADANTGSTMRSQINSALQALASLSSGATAPATTYAYQFWQDTTTGYLKQRNSGNSGWNIWPFINSSGFMGIGTATPTNNLEVSASTSGYGARLHYTGLATALSGPALLFSFVNNSSVKFDGASIKMGIVNGASGLESAVLGFSTSTGGTITERMRIDENGNVSVGTTSSSGKITSLITSTGNCFAALFNTAGGGQTALRSEFTGTTGTAYHAYFVYNAASVGSITSTSTTTTYSTSSDYRLKDQITAIENPIDRLLQLNPVNFRWISTGERSDGFIAHELADVVPLAVVGEKDAVDAQGNPVYQAIDQSKIVPLLTAAVQELTARIAALEAK